jgi:hypothetical protein
MGRATDNESHDDAPTVREPAGKVEIDSHGNRVWRWAKEVLESTSVLLKRLDNKDLALAPTQKVPVLGGAERSRQKQPPSRAAAAPSNESDKPRPPASRRERGDSGGGFDPYNTR